MIWFIVAFGLGLLAWGATEELESGFFTWLFFSMVALFVSLVFGAIIYTGSHFEVTSQARMVNLADGSGIEGHFFLGSGTINDVQKYTWYESDGPNSFVQRQADADLATIHYTTGTPHYTYSEETDNYDFLEFWGFGGIDNNGGEHYDFYIPKGSITNDFELDAK